MVWIIRTERLENITTSRKYKNKITEVIEHAETNNWLLELVDRAVDEHPENKDMRNARNLVKAEYESSASNSEESQNGQHSGRTERLPQLPNGPGAGAFAIPTSRRQNANQTVFYRKIKATSDVDLRHIVDPYSTYVSGNEDHRSTHVHVFFWVPNSGAIGSKRDGQFQSATAVCCLSRSQLVEQLRSKLGTDLLETCVEKCTSLRNEEKEQLFPAIGEAIRDCFMVCITVPELVLSVGKQRPDLAHQSLVSVTLSPVLETHRRLDFEKASIYLAKVGGDKGDKALLSSVKASAKCSFGKRAFSVTWGDEVFSDQVAIMVARQCSWAVKRFFNSGDEKWISAIKN